jgi:hypothetical protein
VSKDILGSAAGLGIRGTLNDTQVQDGNTNNMIFSVAEIVSFLSQGMTLLPGRFVAPDSLTEELTLVRNSDLHWYTCWCWVWQKASD